MAGQNAARPSWLTLLQLSPMVGLASFAWPFCMSVRLPPSFENHVFTIQVDDEEASRAVLTSVCMALSFSRAMPLQVPGSALQLHYEDVLHTAIDRVGAKVLVHIEVVPATRLSIILQSAQSGLLARTPQWHQRLLLRWQHRQLVRRLSEVRDAFEVEAWQRLSHHLQGIAAAQKIPE